MGRIKRRGERGREEGREDKKEGGREGRRVVSILCRLDNKRFTCVFPFKLYKAVGID